MFIALSQVGCRLLVASNAKISLPLWARLASPTALRKEAISFEDDFFLERFVIFFSGSNVFVFHTVFHLTMNEVMPVNNHIQRNLLEIGQLRKVKYRFLLFQVHDLKLACISHEPFVFSQGGYNISLTL